MDNALKVHEKFLRKQEQQLQQFSERRDAMLEKMNEIDQAIRDLSQEQNTANNTLQAEFDAEYAEAIAKDEAERLAQNKKENVAPVAKKANVLKAVK